MANYKYTPLSRRYKPIPISTQFGLLTVIGEAFQRGRQYLVPCRCMCGRKTSPYAFSLRVGESQSCGRCCRVITAEQKAKIGAANSTHGRSRTPEYNAWLAMRKRCLNPNDQAFDRYGGRGITVATEWVNDFPAFLAHVGPRPSGDFSLDRIDNDRGYEPGNVRWANRSTQSRNRRPFVMSSGGKQPEYVMVNGIKYVPERPVR